ncbi:sugar transferase [Microbacterium sp.]|uniref:sugar transferase n=1 Tax=Microbacterium sp. TaxID=51671 RepID=UPI000C44CAEB|nr:sugar transferase [Microbacterium sp.]MBU19264.1 polyprenyl glycosylphosphotransferase [Microbacterium sp.]
MRSTGEPRPWHESYRTRLLISDAVVLVWVVYGTQIVWFGTGNAQLSLLRDLRFTAVSYWLTSAILVALWLLALSLADTRTPGVVGTGMTEYVRVIDSSLVLFGVIAIVAFLFRVDIARGYLLISLPAGILLLLLVRWLWRQWLVAKRRVGKCASGVILIGSPASVAQVGHELQQRRDTGYLVVGACLPPDDHEAGIPTTDADIPVLGTFDDLTRVLADTGADTVLVTSSDALPPEKVKQISWSLEAGRQHLLLAPGIADVAGPRIHTRPVSGLPLVHVETPRFSPGQRFGKRMSDLIVSLVAVVVISPLLGILALAVKLSSPGPVCVRETRIGYHGRPFTMLAFRTAREDDDGTVPTALGRWMHRHTLDDLPQLFNVIGGTMSLVGPRPPLPGEVETYTDASLRRFLVKPGITGLSQISGRENLAWEDAVRLDLSYVENWSLAGDVAIVIKSAKAALLGRAAR